MVGLFLLDACGTMPTELVTGSTHRYNRGRDEKETGRARKE